MTNFAKSVRRIGPVSAGLIVGALTSLLALPVYARFYSIHDFGVYGLVLAFVSVGATVATLRLDQAILVAPHEHRRSLAHCAAVSAALFSFILFIVFSAIKGFEFASAVALGTFSNAMFQLAYSLKFTANRFGTCGLMNAARTFTFAVPQMLVPFWFGDWTMIKGLYFQSALLISWSFSIVFGAVPIISVEWQVWKKYKDFIRHNTPHALLNSFSHNSVYYFAGFLLTPAHVGYYTMVDRILKAPIFLFSQVIRQSLIVRFVNQNYKQARLQALKISVLMVSLAAPFFVGMMFFSEPLFVWALGNDWIGIGRYFVILGIGYLMIFSNPPTTAFLTARRRSVILLRLQLVELVCKVIGACLLFLIFQDELVLLSVTIALFVYNATAFFLVAFGKLSPLPAKRSLMGPNA